MVAAEAELGTTEHEAGIISGRRRLDKRPNRIVRSPDRRLQLSTAPVGEVLCEGDLISGFRVILAPGHTSGPASLLRDEDGHLFAVDEFGAVALHRIRVGAARSFARTHHWQSLRREAAPGGVRHVVMSQDKSLHTGVRQELREAVARCNYA